MPKKSDTTIPSSPKAPHVVPEWAKKVKAYREEAGKIQVEVQTALKSKINTMSLIENGRREFTPEQRTLFFELIGKPEDTTIPTKISDPAPVVSKKIKVATPVPKKAGKAEKPAKPGKPSKVAKAPRKLKVVPEVVSGSEIQDAVPAPPTAEEVASPVAQRNRRSRKSRKASADTALKAVTDYVEKSATDAAPKNTRKARAKKHSLATTVQSGVSEPTPLVVEPTASMGISPVKEAVLRDLNRILSSPGLSDSQAKRLHGLFTSLAVNALLGE